jgi:hypothetical protein
LIFTPRPVFFFFFFFLNRKGQVFRRHDSLVLSLVHLVLVEDLPAWFVSVLSLVRWVLVEDSPAWFISVLSLVHRVLVKDLPAWSITVVSVVRWALVEDSPAWFNTVLSVVRRVQDLPAWFISVLSLVRWVIVSSWRGISVILVNLCCFVELSVQSTHSICLSLDVSRRGWLSYGYCLLSTFHIVNRCSLEPAYSIIRHGSVFVSTVFLIKYPFASGAQRLETSSFYPCRVI